VASTHSIQADVAQRLPGSTRLFATTWIATMTLLMAIQLLARTPVWSLEIALLGVLGFFACARPIRLGSKLEVSAAQPAAFAALLLAGTSAAILVVLCCVLGAMLLRRRSPGALKVAFNLATGVATVLVAGPLIGGGLVTTGGGVDQSIFPLLLAATAIAFPISTIPVATAVALETRQRLLRLWVEKYAPTAMAFLAGSGLALLLAMALDQLGPQSAYFFVPLALLLYKSSLNTVTAQ
jgi:hypothetical protein